MKTIEINGVEYTLESGIKPLLLFEEIAGRAYQGVSLIDNCILLYSTLLSFNPSFEMEFDNFIDYLDKDMNKAYELLRWQCESFSSKKEA